MSLIRIPEPLSRRPLDGDLTRQSAEGGRIVLPPAVEGQPVAPQFLRYFSPRALGIYEAPPRILPAPDGFGGRGFMSNIIDLSFMRSITIQVKRRVTAVGGSESGAPTAISIYLEMAFHPLAQEESLYPEFATTRETAGGIRDQSLILIDSAQFDADVAPFPKIQVANRGRAFDVARGAGSGDASGLYGPLGPYSRIFLSTTLVTTPADQFWSCCAWASS